MSKGQVVDTVAKSGKSKEDKPSRGSARTTGRNPQMRSRGYHGHTRGPKTGSRIGGISLR